jgi:integrase
MAPPLKQPNVERRSREYLTPAEIDRLMAAARHLGRHGHRDATMILVAYRHGLRVSELVGLRREQVDLRQGLLHVRRRKNGLRPARTRCGVQNCGRCASSCVMIPIRLMSLSRNAKRR